MPTINFSLKDLQNLIRKKISVAELKELLEYGKGELEGYDKESDEVSVSFNDTNLPFLWSVEGIGALLKGLLGVEKGIPKIDLGKSDEKIIVDKELEKIRPFIGAFSAKGKRVDDYLIKQMVQIQEKLSESYGQKRKKLAVGIYTHKKIKFPVSYKAVDPESVEFIPLEFKVKLNLKEILVEHPTGKEYAGLMEGFSKYPLLVDDSGQVLSFPPVINSNDLGKVEGGDDDLFIEVTGTDQEAVELAINILATAFNERGFNIYPVTVEYGDRKKIHPSLETDQIRIEKEQIKQMMGFELDEEKIKKLLERMRYNVKGMDVEIPYFRADIMHPFDVVEDVMISYGYDKIPSQPLKSYTIGETIPLVGFVNKVRELMVGMGFQEVLSPVLSNKDLLYKKMGVKDFGTVEIKEYMTERYSVVRSWLIPLLMEVLAKNKNAEYPQRIFEQGLVSAKKGEKIIDYERIAGVICNDKADFTKIKQVLDTVFRELGADYVIEEVEHDSFIPGRAGRVVVGGKKVAFIGEIAPEVLENFNIVIPVAAMELNLTELFEVIK